MCPISKSERRSLQLAAYARQNRSAPTQSEARLWEALRGGRLGVRFRRQVVLGRYIADFCAREVRVVVEVDGASHRGRERADGRRDEWMQREGWRVVRVKAEEVMEELAAVVRKVKAVAGR